MLSYCFYWFFYPQVALAEWHRHMMTGVIYSAIFILLGFFIYAFIPYNREREPVKFFFSIGFIVILSVGYAIVSTSSMPDEICREAYKWRFGFSFVIATLLYGLLSFTLLSFFLGAKKYFARFYEHFYK